MPAYRGGAGSHRENWRPAARSRPDDPRGACDPGGLRQTGARHRDPGQGGRRWPQPRPRRCDVGAQPLRRVRGGAGAARPRSAGGRRGGGGLRGRPRSAERAAQCAGARRRPRDPPADRRDRPRPAEPGPRAGCRAARSGRRPGLVRQAGDGRRPGPGGPDDGGVAGSAVRDRGRGLRPRGRDRRWWSARSRAAARWSS